MSITLEPDTEARLLAAARARGKTPDALVASLLSILPAEAGEADLLQQIGQGLPEAFWKRYRTLAARRQAETLTPDEQAELVALSDQAEERTLRRTRALAELAARRGIPLSTLARQMGLRPAPVSP